MRFHSERGRNLNLRDGAGGRRGEVEADGGLLCFRFAIGMEMGLQNEVRVGGQMVRDAGGQEFGRGAGNPAAQAAGDGVGGVADGFDEENSAEAGKAGLAVKSVHGARLTGGIGIEEDVVDGAPRGGLQLDGFDPVIGSETGAQDEVAIDVGTVRRHGEAGRHGEDEVGRAELPAVGEGGKRRFEGGIALRHPGGHPLLDKRNLGCGETALVAERNPAGIRFPRRHVAGFRDRGDCGRMLLHVGITHQRERSNLAGAVARRAVVVNDGRNVLAVIRRLSSGSRGDGQAQK
jgi:hypothetical protein